jgi:hypothetical protein
MTLAKAFLILFYYPNVGFDVGCGENYFILFLELKTFVFMWDKKCAVDECA